MVIAKVARCGDRDPCHSQLYEELLRPCDTAERDTWFLCYRNDSVTANSPEKLVSELQSVCGRVVRKHDRIGARQGRHWFAQPSCWQKRILRVGGRDQHDVEISSQASVLETVIEQVQLRAEGCFCHLACAVPILAYNDGHSQLACDQQRLVAEVASRAARVNDRYTLRLAAVAA